MRIISGKFGGRRLVSFDADHLRPTTDRVKEVIFNKIMFEIDGTDVLDLFSGTGNLSIEAISRGARVAVAVEESSKSIAIIKKNAELLKLGKKELDIQRSDVFDYIKRFRGPAFDIIFVDPPFTKAIADKVMEALSTFRGLKATTKIIIESGKKEIIKDNYSPIVLLERKDFGDKQLSFFGVHQGVDPSGKSDAKSS